VARLSKPLRLIVALLVAGIVLSSCGAGGALSDVRTSCRSVHAALVLEKKSEESGLSEAAQSELQAEAMSELLKATPSAAAATSLDGSWNPLMTTINEAERVPINFLAPALSRLCQVANSSTPYP
jgi:hypothetical protein